MKIKVTNKEGASIEVDYPISEVLSENVERFGEDVCAANLVSALVLRVQGKVRTMLNDEKTTEADIHNEMKTWKIGVPRERGATPVEKAKRELDKLSPEERAALLKELRAQQKAAA